MSTERPSAKKHSPRRTPSNSGIADILKLSALSVAISLAGMIVVSFFAALILFGTEDPLSAVVPTSVTLICLVSLASGFLSHKLCKLSPVFTGLLSGVILAIFVLIVALLLKDGSSPALASGTRVIMHIIPIPLSVLGAFLGSLKPQQRHRTTIRRR